MVDSRERPIKEANKSNARVGVEVLVDVQVGHCQYFLLHRQRLWMMM